MPSTLIDDSAIARKTPAVMPWPGSPVKIASGPNGTTMNSTNVETSTMIGAIVKIRLSARSGMMSSFCRNFATSAKSCMDPNGPASIGPSRLCMKLTILKR